VNLLFACCEEVRRKADSKIEGWEQSKQTKEGVLKQALQAGSAVSTSVASAMAQGVNRPTPTVASHLRSDERRRGKRVTAGLVHVQHGKRELERLNNVQKGQG